MEAPENENENFIDPFSVFQSARVRRELIDRKQSPFKVLFVSPLADVVHWQAERFKVLALGFL